MNWLSFFMGAGAVILIEWLIFTTLVIKAVIRKASGKTNNTTKED